MRDLIARFFGGRGNAHSKDEAKNRLKFLLVHDQVDISPAQMEQMKNEIMEVISRYVDVDSDGTAFKLERSEGCISLVSSVPVRRVYERPAAPAPSPQ